jgi:hypothetical protein
LPQCLFDALRLVVVMHQVARIGPVVSNIKGTHTCRFGENSLRNLEKACVPFPPFPAWFNLEHASALPHSLYHACFSALGFSRLTTTLRKSCF